MMYALCLLHVQALAGGREWQLLEARLLTPQGYKLLQCCRMALDQLQKVLALEMEPVYPTGSSSNCQAAAAAAQQAERGACSSPTLGPSLESAARGFMGLMCEGRLVPTTWLNEVGHTAAQLSLLALFTVAAAWVVGDSVVQDKQHDMFIL
jgi:hypothetical protein